MKCRKHQSLAQRRVLARYPQAAVWTKYRGFLYAVRNGDGEWISKWDTSPWRAWELAAEQIHPTQEEGSR